MKWRGIWLASVAFALSFGMTPVAAQEKFTMGYGAGT
jgi:hypothetical protein